MKLRIVWLIALLASAVWACQRPTASVDTASAPEKVAADSKTAKAADEAKPVDLDEEEADHDHGEEGHEHGDAAELADKAARAKGPLDVKVGAALVSAEKVGVLELMKDPSKYEGKTVRVEGKVTDMCYHARGWFGVTDPTGQRVLRIIATPRFRAPEGAIGSTAVAEGAVKVSTLKRADLDHYKKVHKFISEEELKADGPIRQAVIIASGAEFKR